MNQTPAPNRFRIVLIASPRMPAERVAAALFRRRRRLPPPTADGADEAAFQAFAERVAPGAQAAGVAGGESTATAASPAASMADGLHVEAGKDELADAIRAPPGPDDVGAGAPRPATRRWNGEERPDYMFFGRFGYDTKPEPHARNLALGAWWAEMIEIPCIVMAGSDLASVEAVAATGAEFVALSAAIFAEGADAKAAVVEANARLDRAAPRFGN